MAVEPIPISEITNVKGDGDLYSGSAGGGAAAAVIPPSDTAKYILAAAQAQNEANKYVSELHEKRLNDVLNTLNGLNYKDSMASDLPDISKNYASLMGDIGDNYGAITDPASNLQKWQEFKGRLGSLQSQIQTSQAHNAVYQENQKLMQLHPDYNTAENQQLMSNFAGTPMSDRKNFLLKTPTTYDPANAGAYAEKVTKQVVNKDELSKGKTYIINTKGEYIDPDKFVDNFINYSKVHTDSYGRTDMQNLENLYNKGNIPVNEDGTKPSFDQFLRDIALHAAPQSTKAVTMKPNEAKIHADQLGFEYYKQKLDHAADMAKINLQGELLKPNQIKPDEAAEAKNLVVYNLTHGQGVDPAFAQNMWGSDPANDIKVSVGGVPHQVTDPDGNTHLEISPTTTQKVPQKEYVSSKPDPNNPGGIINTFKINTLDTQSGKLDTKMVQERVNAEQLMSDGNRIYGAKFAPQVSSGSSKFNKEKLGTTNPAIADLEKYFGKAPSQAAPAQPAGGRMTDEQYQNYLRQKGLIK